jgi:hypothetical protein
VKELIREMGEGVIALIIKDLGGNFLEFSLSRQGFGLFFLASCWAQFGSNVWLKVSFQYGFNRSF